MISPELKWEGDRLYLVKHTPLADRMPDTEQLKRNWDHIQEKIEDGTIVAGWAVGFGGVAEALCKMSFGNAFGFDVNLPEDELFNLSYGSIVVETDGSALDFENAVEIGTVTSGEDGNVRVNGTKLSIFEMMDFNASLFEKVYPAVSKPDFKRLLPKGMEGVKPFKAKKADLEYKGPKVDKVIAYLPVFPGTELRLRFGESFPQGGSRDPHFRVPQPFGQGCVRVNRPDEEEHRGLSDPDAAAVASRPVTSRTEAANSSPMY